MKKFRFTLTALVVIAVLLIVHRCVPSAIPGSESSKVSEPESPSSPDTTPAVLQAETTAVDLEPQNGMGNPPPAPNGGERGITHTIAPTVSAIAPPAPSSESSDSIPYVYADPWGGRHFDSVTVNLHCQQDCPILYSLDDSIHLKPYRGPFTFKSNASLWFTGVSSRGYRAPIVQLDYVIEKNPQFCPDGAMPVAIRGHEICVDVYEWPNREGAKPSVMVSQEEATDSCQRIGKHLCSLEEWQSACHGPEELRYPYGDNYNERYCPAQQANPSRSGRLPACRSYYGIFDLAGNVWEWTSTIDPNHKDFYMVAGGGWNGADNATCSMAKYSFYPQNRYPSVGFRCCDGVK